MVCHLKRALLWSVVAVGLAVSVAAAAGWADSRTSQDGLAAPFGSGQTAGVIIDGQAVWVGVDCVSNGFELIHRSPPPSAIWPLTSHGGFGLYRDAAGCGAMFVAVPAWLVIVVGASAAVLARRRLRRRVDQGAGFPVAIVPLSVEVGR